MLGWALRKQELAPALGLLIAAAIFNARSSHLFDSQSLTAVSTAASTLGIVAVAVCLLMIAGEFDLSVGTVYAFIPIVWVILFKYNGVPILAALLLSLLVAVGIGLTNGVVAVRFRVPSFITTLGMFFALEGLNNLLVGGGDMVITEPDRGSAVVDALGQRLGGSPFYASLVWTVAVATLGWMVLTRTTYGNWTFAAGGRVGVARSLGVPVGGVKIASFALTALLAGFAGCLQTAYLGSVTSAQGQDLALLAITAIVVGGTSIHGGSGSVVGAVLGAVLVSLIQVGLILIGAPGTFYVTFIGLLLIAVVIGNSRLTLLQQLIRP
jgi:simple sugar transport system permease protein